MRFDVAKARAQIAHLSQLSQGVTLQTDKAALPPASTHGPDKSTPTCRAQNAQAGILGAIRAGIKTPGAIATATRLGATATYQELDRMTAAGLLTMARDGTYCLARDGGAP